MAASDARPIARKNVAYRVTFPIWDADGDLVTGATGLDSEVSIDGGTFADCTNEATEIATASGIYFLDLTAAEMNGDTVAVIVKTSTSGAKTTPMVFYPEEAGDLRVDVVQLSGDATAADNAESFFDGTGYAGTNNVIPSVTTVTGNVNGSVASVTGAVGSVTGNVGGNVSGSVGSVTGNVGGNVVGSVASVTADVGITQTGADKVWGSTTRTLSSFGTLVSDIWSNASRTLSAFAFSVTVGTNNDKTGYALSSAGVQAVWDALTSALTTANSIGKLIADNLNATISSRLASASYTAPDNASVATILTRTDVATSTRLASASYTAPDNAGIATIQAAVDTEVGAIKTQTDRFATMIELDGSVYRYTINALEQAPQGGGGGGGATAEQIWEYESRTLTQFGALTGVAFTYTLTDSVSALPIANARVAFTTDLAGSNVVWVGYTDAFGVARDTLGNLPSLEAGTYYVFRSKSGYTFSNPDTEVVS